MEDVDDRLDALDLKLHAIEDQYAELNGMGLKLEP
jgi:hypothetical protein